VEAQEADLGHVPDIDELEYLAPTPFGLPRSSMEAAHETLRPNGADRRDPSFDPTQVLEEMTVLSIPPPSGAFSMPSSGVFLCECFIPIWSVFFTSMPLFLAIWWFNQPFFVDSSNFGSTVVLRLAQSFSIWVYCFSSTILLLLTKWLVMWRYTAGTYAKDSWYYQRWHLTQNSVAIWETSVGWMFRRTPFLNLVYKLLGANIAMSARLEVYIRDFDLVEIEHNTLVMGKVLAHMHAANPQRVHLAPVKVGANCFISGDVVIEPGAIVCRGSFLNNMSVVPMGVHLPGKLKWHGNPVRPCGPSGCKSLEQGPSFARIPTGILIPMIVILSATTLFEYFQENVFGTTTAAKMEIREG